MSANPESVSVQPLNFRRYKDGDHKPGPWQKQIFNADHSHKCPTYIQSTPPCQGSCPSGEASRCYLNIVRGVEKPPAGMPWQEYAFRRLTEANPFPSVMGRVCPAPCESGCNPNQVEDFVGINSVEHFLGEYAIANNLGFKKPDFSSGKKVAVIGGGPAGLSTAYQLALRGHAVTLFDERAELGGMMRYGIPGFRTPRQALDAEIQRLLDLGVVARTNCRMGPDITLEQLRADFAALFLGLGPQSGRGLPVEGADAPNCVTATSFLKAFNDGRLRHVGKRVVVVGGGDTSIDVATVARRLGHIDQIHESDRPEHAIAGHVAHDVAAVSAKQGADVTLTSIFAVDKMQASRHEVEHALSEGIDIRGGLAPVGVVRGPDGRATALRVIRCEAKIVGGKLEIKNIEKGLSFSEVHEPIHGTDKSNVAIHNFDNRSDRYVISHKELFLGHFAYTPRNRRTIVSLTAEEALGNFDERLQALVEAQAQAEAKRCMSCGQCFECDNCVVYCQQIG